MDSTESVSTIFALAVAAGRQHESDMISFSDFRKVDGASRELIDEAGPN
jgi:hypothetical protein